MPDTSTGTASAPESPRHDYVIRGGTEGKRRLEILSRAFWPATFQLLKRTGFHPGMTCLDLGCGGGDVTRGIARLVGPTGRAVGIDMDPVKLEAARLEAARQNLVNVEFHSANIYEWSAEAAYDRIYSRFLLTHLPDSPTALNAMRRALRPGGRLVVEDIDMSGSFCYPPCPAFDRYVHLYREVVSRRKGDPDIGPKLHSLLTAAGFQSVHLTLVHPIFIDSEEKVLALSTFLNIMDALVSEGLACREELQRTAAELDAFSSDPTTIVSAPRIFQAWGSRA